MPSCRSPSARERCVKTPMFAAKTAALRRANQEQMPADFDQEVARVLGELHRLEVDTLRQMDRTGLDRQGQIRTVGVLLLFDKHFSVNQSEASASVTPRDRIHGLDPSP